METTCQNRDGNTISVRVEEPTAPPRGLAFVMHGLGSNKDAAHLRAMVEAFLQADFRVVSWDAVHTFGASTGGLFEDATVTNYYADLEDVVQWAATQPWYEAPFVLCGHSLGGISVTLFAEKYPEKVRALAPIATVVSGELSVQSGADDIAAWRAAGVRVTAGRDGSERRLKWAHMEDRLRYNVLPDAQRLTMPVCMVVGSRDAPTPPAHQALLFAAIPEPKEMHIIADAEHSFTEPSQRAELTAYLTQWAHTV